MSSGSIAEAEPFTRSLRIKTKSGAEFSEMLFFDDEHRNKHDLDTIGVRTVIVDDGITRKLVKQGLEEFSRH
ncbi:hypothetical protein O3P69_013006 [Scylla paramamosain]|uniref:Uncharacterized protein n=1 Tax=Scylla paramamosain TaxID=85552 RepID=A0AAW0TR08_SCYPA